MAEFSMSAGSKFESLTQKELNASLKEWMVDVAKGCRPVLINAQGAADTTGLVTIGGATSLTGGTLGPEVGYWWAVMRLAVRIDGLPAAYSLFQNVPLPHQLIRDVNGDANGYVAFNPTELMIPGGDTIVIRGSSITPGSAVTVTGQAIELPNQLLWKWLTA